MRTAAKDTSTFGLGLGAAGERAKGFLLSATKITSILGVAGFAAAVYKGTHESNELNASLARLNTQVGVSETQIEGLKIGVLDLAGEVGADPESLAESLFHVESNFKSMGITSEKALELVEVAAKGAKIGNADLVDVTNALTAAVAANIPGVENLDEAMGALNATVGAGDMTMQDLANAFGTGMVAVVKGYGLSIHDVSAALAVFGDNNIRGAQAGTALRMTVQSLAVPARSGKAALEKLGLAQDTLAKDMQKGGLNAAITDLHERLKKAGIGAKEQGEVLTAAFGKKAGVGLAMLVDQFDRLEGKYGEIEERSDSFAESWAGTQNTTKQKIDEMKGSFDAMLISLGDATKGVQGKLAGIGASAFQKLGMGAAAFAGAAGGDGTTTSSTKWVGQVELAGVRAREEMQRLGDTLGNAKKIVTDLAPTFLQLAKVVGGGLIIGLHAFEGAVNLASEHTGTLKVALIAIGGIMLANKVATVTLTAAQAASNIVTLITTARTSGLTAALGANSVAKSRNLIGTRLLTAAYNSSLVTLVRSVAVWTAQKVAMLASAVATRAMAAGQWLLNAAMSANPITLVVIAIAALVAGAILAYKHVGWFRDAVNAVGRALKSAGEWIAHVAVAFGHGLVDAFGKAEGAAKAVGRFFARLYEDVKHWLGVAVDFVKKWWPVFAIVMTGGAAAIPILIWKYWQQIVNFTKSAFNSAKDFVVGVFKAIYNGIATAVSAVLGFVGRHWRLLLVLITGPIGLIIVMIVNAKDRIIRGFEVMWRAVSGFAQRIWKDVSGFFSRLWSDVSGFVAKIWHDVAGFFSKMWSDVSGFASRIWHDVAGFFSKLWSDVSGWVSRTWHDVAGFFSKIWADVTGFASRIWHDVAGFYGNLWRDVSGWVSRTWHDVVGFYANLWRDVTGFASRIWSDVSGFFSNLWRDVTGWVSRLWHDVAGFFTNMWNDAKSAASNLWKDVTGWFDKVKTDVSNSVKTAVGWVKAEWDRLKDIFKTPINFLINTVYNDGIRPVWNAFAGIVHEGKLDKVNGLQAGGRLPGYGGGDIIPAMLEPGEAVVPKHLVPEMAPWARKRGIPGFALGGVVGAVTHAVTHPLDTLESLGEGTLDVLGKAVHWVRGALATAAETALAPVRAAIHATLGTGHDWKGVTGQIAIKPLDKIVEMLRGQDKKDQAEATSSGGAPVAAAPRGEIQAYAMELLTGRGWAGQWNAFNALVMGESGWNPAARNPSSGAYGIPQALPPSKLDAYGNRNDYHVQLRWMLDYIAGRYGTPGNAYSTWLGRSPHWYDQGGPLKPGLTLAANGTGRDEWVVPKSAVAVKPTRGSVALTLHVDARNATDPAAVEAAIGRASERMLAELDRMLQQGEGNI
ncbi:phage tail tape measure protein [Frankia sp. CcI49]|nr:phage tail tape measure protein [Frankia sp. CcI49]